MPTNSFSPGLSQRQLGILPTPCIHSEYYSNPDRDVWLKMEALNPSGSFKDRGMAHLIKCMVQNDGKKKFVCSSGGNAGHAAAYVCKMLKVPIRIVVPKTTPQIMLERIRRTGGKFCTLEIWGENWNMADSKCQMYMQGDSELGYIHPFEDKRLWEGHSQIVVECKEVLEQQPDCIIVSVGGGGLMLGIAEGLRRVGWTEGTTIIAVETIGCDSLMQAVAARELITLPKISSVATSMGARRVHEKALDLVLSGDCRVIPQVVTDRAAVEAIPIFLDQERVLIEPACSATLAVLQSEELKEFSRILVVVCGGGNISSAILEYLLRKTAANSNKL